MSTIENSPEEEENKEVAGVFYAKPRLKKRFIAAKNRLGFAKQADFVEYLLAFADL